VEDDFGYLRIGANIASLIHQASSHLPKSISQCASRKYSWKLTDNFVGELIPSNKKTYKYVLSSNKRDPQASQPKSFLSESKKTGKQKMKLRPEQLRSLWWMIQQERDDVEPFEEEEISESILAPIGWRLEGKVVQPVRIKGGIIADDVSFLYMFLL
jgi:hypothetical protein